MMEPSGLPQATGGSRTAAPGRAPRLLVVLAGLLAVAGVAVAVTVFLLGPTTATSVPVIGVIVAVGLAAFVTGRATAVGADAPRLAERVRTRAAVRDRAADHVYLTGEIRERWRTAAEGAGLGWLVHAPSGRWVSTPLVMGVELQPPFTVLKIRLRPGQLVSDLVAAQHRLRELMGADGIRIRQRTADVVTVELW